MRLLFSGEKFIDESFPDYLVRMAYWNGFQSLESFLSALRKIYRELYIEKDSEEKKRANLGNPGLGSRDSSWLECRHALEAVLKRNFCSDQMNFSKSTQKGRLSEAYFCHDCWRESPYIRFYWRLDSYCLCHKHGAELQAFDLRSYHPDVQRLCGWPSDRSAEESLNSKRIQEFLLLRGDAGCTMKELLSELECIGSEYRIWFSVVKFMESRFDVVFRFEELSTILDSCVSTGLDTLLRLESVINKLTEESDATEKLVKVVALIFFKMDRVYHIYSVNFRSWAEAEAYSINPLFASYLFGIGDSLFGRKDKVRELQIIPVLFSGRSEREICQFIIDSGVFSKQELDTVRAGRKFDKGVMSPLHGFMLFHGYSEYIDLVEGNIFDSTPVARCTAEKNVQKTIPM